MLLFAWLSAAAFAASLGYFLYSWLFVFGRVPDGGDTAESAVINLLLFSAFALHHSLFARTRVKALVTRVSPPQLERAIYTLIASVLFVLVCRYWQPVAGVLYELHGWWRLLPYLSLAAGLVITAAGARALDALELAGVRQVMQRPARDREPPPLETGGVYGFVRHPVYFGWVLVMLGTPAMTMTRLTFAVISILYLAIAVPFEERGLQETFGADYASYRQKVRWRMLPGLY